MKTLTKLITIATSTLIAIFTITILLSTTPTYAATSVDVYCDGVDDQEKFYTAFSTADEPTFTINVIGDCIFSSELSINASYDQLTIRGTGNNITADDSYSDILISIYGYDNSNTTIENINLNAGDASASFGMSSGGSANLILNNINVNGFHGGIVTEKPDLSTTISGNGLTITGTKSFDIGFGSVDAAILIFLDNNDTHLTLDWNSGKSDADVAIAYYLVDGTLSSILSSSIGSAILQDTDFDSVPVGSDALFTTVSLINHFVNCGFPVGSQWDICPDTGNGTEEPDGGNNGNEIEAPDTGIGSGVSAAVIVTGLFVAGCGIAAYSRTY